jgi:hypothetical protein
MNDTRRAVAMTVTTSRRWMSCLAIVVVLGWAPFARSDATANPPTIGLGQGSQLWVEGDSTLHKYRLDAKELRISLLASRGGAGLPDIVAQGGIKTLDVHVPVHSLTSGESGLDSNMRSAMKEDQFHEIRFQMDSYQSNPGTLKIRGRLQIAGVEKPVELDAASAADGPGLRVTGTTRLLLSDYGIKAPKFMLGTMTVADAVDVHFVLRLELAH